MTNHDCRAMALKPKPNYLNLSVQKSQDRKKSLQVRSNDMDFVIVFFDCNGMTHHEFLPPTCTVNRKYYLEVMRRLLNCFEPENMSEKYVRKILNCGKTNYGFRTVITYQLTRLCMRFWPKTKQ